MIVDVDGRSIKALCRCHGSPNNLASIYIYMSPVVLICLYHCWVALSFLCQNASMYVNFSSSFVTLRPNTKAALSWIWLKFHFSLFLVIRLIINQHWLRYWCGADQAKSHYMHIWTTWPLQSPTLSAVHVNLSVLTHHNNIHILHVSPLLFPLVCLKSIYALLISVQHAFLL